MRKETCRRLKIEDCFKKIKKAAGRADRWILDFLYPPRCPVCDTAVLPQRRICAECRKKMRLASGIVCLKCGKPLADGRQEFCADCAKKTRNFAQGRALWIYEKEARESIYRFKYQNKREYGTAYAEEIAKRDGAWIKGKGIQAIVPVPLHKKRQKKRGYNQAEILAKELGVLLDIPARTDILKRVRDTKPQKMLNNAQRKRNLQDAFLARKGAPPECVLLVDDIYTTGSTLNAAAGALLEAGAKKVYAYCVGIGADA